MEISTRCHAQTYKYIYNPPRSYQLSFAENNNGREAYETYQHTKRRNQHTTIFNIIECVRKIIYRCHSAMQLDKHSVDVCKHTDVYS